MDNKQELCLTHHTTAEDFLSLTYPTLVRTDQNESSSNIILAHALERTSSEFILTQCRFLTDADVRLVQSHPPLNASDCFWMAVWSTSTTERGHQLDVIMSCISGPFGGYPIFLWSPSECTSGWLEPRMELLLQHLARSIQPERVFSVFGKTALVDVFVPIWTAIAKRPVKGCLYSAFFMQCTKLTFKDSPIEPPPGHSLRKTAVSDETPVANLCKEFSEASIHFPLNQEEALIEAQMLIDKGQVWVYEVHSEVAAICCVTRSSLSVSAVTKVYTVPEWRRKGIAERLVRFVTKKLFEVGKHAVVLYVGRNNDAQSVYLRVGFVGVHGNGDNGEVSEVGFEGTNWGHW